MTWFCNLDWRPHLRYKPIYWTKWCANLWVQTEEGGAKYMYVVLDVFFSFCITACVNIWKDFLCMYVFLSACSVLDIRHHFILAHWPAKAMNLSSHIWQIVCCPSVDTLNGACGTTPTPNNTYPYQPLPPLPSTALPTHTFYHPYHYPPLPLSLQPHTTQSIHTFTFCLHLVMVTGNVQMSIDHCYANVPRTHGHIFW